MKITRYSLYFLLVFSICIVWLYFNFWSGVKATAPMEELNKHYVVVDKSVWENPLVNSLFIPLGLYFGKKLIDIIFLRFENKKGKIQ